jgi:hypothetical protein
MAFLQIGALAPFDVQTQGAAERTRADRRASTEGSPTYGGGLRRQGLGRKREWPFTSAPLTRATYDLLVTACYGSAYQHCTGDALPAGGVDCIVTIDDAVYVDDTSDALGFKMVAQLTLREK